MKKIIVILFIMYIIINIAFADFIGQIDLYVGESADLDVYFVKETEYVDTSDIYWTTDDSSIVSVDSNGTIKANRHGRTFVTATSRNDEGAKPVTTFVSVKSSVSSIEFSHDEISVKSGEIFYPDFTINLINDEIKDYNKSISYKSLNTSVVEVQGDKLISKKSGKARVYVYTDDGGKLDFIDIIVKSSYKDLNIDNLSINQKFYVGEEIKLSVVDEDNDQINSNLSYYSTNVNIAEVDSDGNIIFKSSGRVMIKVSESSGLYDYKYIDVESMVSAVEVDESKVVFDEIGSEIQLSSKLIWSTSEAPIVDGVLWSSSNSSVVSVTDGKLISKANGTSRISVISDDGAHVDYCSVTVDDGSGYESSNTLYVRDFDINVDDITYYIGEEIPLNLTYTPDTAEQNSFSFDLSKGGSSQIVKRDDNYYIKPTVSGDIYLTVTSESDVEKKVLIEVEKSLDSIALKHSMIEGEKNRAQIYYGEEILVNVEFNPIDDLINYDEEYELSSLKDRVEFSDKTESGFVIKGKSSGEDTIIVKSKYSNRQTQLYIEVNDLMSKISIGETDSITVGASYTPTVEFEVVDNDRGISEPFEKGYMIEILSSYIPIKYIQDEIEYEKNAIEDLTHIDNYIKGVNAVLEDEIDMRSKRKRYYEDALKSVYNGYYKMIKSSKLTDRSGSLVSVASVSGDKIIGLFEGYVTYQVKSTEGSKVTRSTLSFTSLINDYIVKKEGDILSSSEKALVSEVESKIQDEMNTAIKDRFSSANALDIPSESYIECIIELEAKVKLDDELKIDYGRFINKNDFYMLMLDVVKSSTDYKTKTLNYSVYLDDYSGIFNEAYNLGFIGLIKGRKIYPDELLSFEEFRNSILKLKKVLDVKSDGSVLDDDYVNYILGESAEYATDDFIIMEFEKDNNITLEKVIYIINKLIK